MVNQLAGDKEMCVYKRKGSPFYLVKFTIGQETKRISTKCKEKRAAKRAAKQIIIAHLQRPIGNKNSNFSQKNKTIEENSYDKGITMGELFDHARQWLTTPGDKPQCLENYINQTRHIAGKLFPENDNLENIAVDDYCDAVNSRYTQKIVQNISTYNSTLRKIKGLFSKNLICYYRENGVDLPDQPISLKPLKNSEEGFVAPENKNLHKDILSASEELKESDINSYLAIQIALRGGLRRQEIFFLKWKDVNDQGIFVRSDKLHRTKNGKSRLVPVSNDFLEILGKYRKNPEEFVIPGGGTRPKVRGDKTAHRANKWLKKYVGEYDRKPLHYCRKLFGATVASDPQLGIYTASKWLGHSSIDVTQKYYADLISTKRISF